MKLFKLLFLGILASLIIACGGDDPDPEPTCETDNLTYTNGASQILNASCAIAGCHVDGTATFRMDNYDDAFLAVGFGRIIGSINHEENFKPMPYPEGSDKLEDCDIDKLTAWINAGAPE